LTSLESATLGGKFTRNVDMTALAAELGQLGLEVRAGLPDDLLHPHEVVFPNTLAEIR
jgi:hypothetical protein